jgi:hypothetical protein
MINAISASMVILSENKHRMGELNEGSGKTRSKRKDGVEEIAREETMAKGGDGC